mmetsp:Transcript_20910/g.23881  ORF Transcript_20910/g.23881 Transcript_20910/m.23881 type:complete len:556 (-) Transcript_20910:136-1803(-)
MSYLSPLQFTVKRVVPALTIAGVGVWATVTTVNDDWDDYIPNFSSNASSEKSEKIVILGGGWAGLNALRKCAGPGKDIVVVSPRPHFLYTPLLAGSAVGTITLRSACEPLRALVNSAAAKASSATFIRAHAREVDLVNKKVHATTGEDGLTLQLKYDKLIVAVGSMANTFGIPGVQENALFLKEAEDSARLHAKLLSNLEKASALMSYGAGDGNRNRYDGEIDKLLKIVIVGAGPTGVELSAEMSDFAHKEVRQRYGAAVSARVRIILVEALPRILGPFDENIAKTAKEHLIERGVEVRTCMAVTRAGFEEVTLAPSTPRSATPEEKKAALDLAETEDVGIIVWAAGIGTRPLVKKIAKALGQKDMRGLKVDPMLRVEGTEGVYAIGDAALAGYAPTAQVAAQEGKHIGRAIRDGKDSPFTYTHGGSLCTLGQNDGIAQLVVGNGNNSIWDAIGAPTAGKDGDQRVITGSAAFVMWRSVYWTKLLSNSSRLHLSMDWLSSMLSGRDVVEPVLQRSPTRPPPVESFGTPLQRNPSIRIKKEPTPKEAKKIKKFLLF